MFADFSDRKASWSFSTGAGLDKNGRGVWHDQLALIILTAALQREPVFWSQVERVRGGESALELASRYGTRRRRALIGSLLGIAGAQKTNAASATRLDNAGTCAWTVEEASRGHYANRPDYLADLLEGAESIARRGGSKCLACGRCIAQDARDVTGRRRVRRDYCSSCSAAETDYRRRQRRDRIDITVAAASQALARGAGARPSRPEQPAVRVDDVEPWSREKREAWLAERASGF